MATLETFKAQLDAMDPEERDELLESLVMAYETEEANIASTEDLGAEMRDTAMPGMRDAGRFKVAASPGEFIGAAGQRAMGHVLGRQARDARAAMGGRQTQAMRQMQDMMLGGGNLGRQRAAASALRALERGR